MRRRGLLALAGLLFALPTVSESSPRVDEHTPRPPDAARGERPMPGRALRLALEDGRFETDELAAIRSSGFTAGPDGDLWSDRCEIYSGADRWYHCPSIEPMEGWDLDGDGNDEFFTIEHDPGDNRLVARHASDGSVLWSHPLFRDQLGIAHVVPVERPGVDAVAVIQVVEDDHAVFPEYETVIELDQSISLLDPRSGAPEWSLRIPGYLVIANRNLIAASYDVVDYIRTIPRADHDDILIGSFSSAGQVFTTYRTLSGSTGAGLEKMMLTGIPDMAEPMRSPMFASGIGLATLRWIDGAAVAELFELDGRSMLQIPLEGVQSMYVEPLRVAAEDDLVTWTYVWGTGSTLKAFDGRDGTQIWSANRLLYFRDSIDRDGTTDLFAWSWTFEDPGWREEVQSLDGASLEPRWVVNPGPPPSNGAIVGSSAWCFCLVDTTGDGVLDTAYFLDQYDDDNDKSVWTAGRWVDGRTGEIGDEVPLPTTTYPSLRSIGDLDQSGGDELIYRLAEVDERNYYIVPTKYEFRTTNFELVAEVQRVPGREFISFFVPNVSGDQAQVVMWQCDRQGTSVCAWSVGGYTADGRQAWEVGT
jgi:hypothetical protein